MFYQREVVQILLLFISKEYMDRSIRTNKSLANQFGISQKNYTQNQSGGIGLNPNLNIEDQYIQNLLKQVHFLSMEIKLMKEKQKENKGMGIMGLLNKDQNPVVTHAITSNNKFSQMKKSLEDMVNNASTQYLKLDDENVAVKAQRDHLQRLSLKQEQKNILNKLYVEKQLTEGVEKLKEGQKRLQNLREQNDRLTDQQRRIKQEWQKYRLEDKTKRLIMQIVLSLDNQSHGLRSKHLQCNEDHLKNHANKLEQAHKINLADPNYIDLVKENEQLKQKLKKTDKELFDLNYKVKQKEQLKKLSIKNRDVEQQLKKQAVQESERTSKKLNDRKTEFQSKLKQSKNALQSNDEVRLLKGKIARKDKQIADVKRRTDTSQANYKKLKDQVMKLNLNLFEKRQSNKKLEQTLHKLTAQSNQSAEQLRQIQLDHEKNQSQLKTATNDLNVTRKRLEDLEQLQAYLSAQEDHLKKLVDVQQQMKKVKIQQLTALVQSNSGLNSTISDVMQRWQQIIKFSREPPSG